MAIHPLPGDHLQLSCDNPGCPAEIIARVSEDELLERAEAQGWNVDRDFGLHYCPLATVHDCDVCGAPTRSSIRDASTGEVTYYCDRDWPY